MRPRQPSRFNSIRGITLFGFAPVSRTPVRTLNPGFFVKTIQPFIILVSLVTGAMAQPAPTTPATSPQTREAAIRQGLDRSYAQLGNGPATKTNAAPAQN